MHLERITAENNNMFLRSFDLYMNSFPKHEQRNLQEQINILAVNEYHYDIIFDEGIFVGLLLYWETESFIYVEHFCINTAIRGKGYGKQALKLLDVRNKTIILEIDPPVDEISQRRLHFYRSAGYLPNIFPHIHPPYKPNYKGHELVVLSCPQTLTDVEYARFNDYLRVTVMHKI